MTLLLMDRSFARSKGGNTIRLCIVVDVRGLYTENCLEMAR